MPSKSEKQRHVAGVAYTAKKEGKELPKGAPFSGASLAQTKDFATKARRPRDLKGSIFKPWPGQS